MAYNNALTSRLDELRSRNGPITTTSTTTSENTSGYTTPARYSGSFMTSHSQSINDARASLQRRFTTDMSKVPNLTPIGQQPAQAPEPVEVPNTVSSVPLERCFGSQSHRRYRTELPLSLFLHLSWASGCADDSIYAQTLHKVQLVSQPFGILIHFHHQPFFQAVLIHLRSLA